MQLGIPFVYMVIRRKQKEDIGDIQEYQINSNVDYSAMIIRY